MSVTCCLLSCGWHSSSFLRNHLRELCSYS
ncbi:hypothetical protein LINPERPRIM_LOCUS24799 [Linum perenne]